ncbi:F1F0 ATP synthase subunit A [Morchella conica CCBAS932]|uniref:ATP synthase subunit a n=1 Tax=Morchella conica CCBAS932 TaxID=1392247 RepID=A0A3N4K729_9PEZI|nr:F1F0 ATP synthase subunit A [Morchella conica CCBAS932]
MMNLYTKISSPLDQFEVRNLLSFDAPILGNIHLSITNIGQIYFPFIFALFIFILVNNLIGMVPYILGATILGFKKHGFEFFSLFVPAGCPLALLPLLCLIETVSYIARAVSLGLRLSANILSGHMLLTFIIAFSGLEIVIALVQAQVFVILTCTYIKDSLDLHS